MRILKAALNHRYAVIACLCLALGGFGLGFIVAKSLSREPQPGSPLAQQNATPQVAGRDAEASPGTPASPRAQQYATPQGISKDESPVPSNIAEELLSVPVQGNSKDATPAPKVPLGVAVLTQHPGMPPDDIERNITNRMKRWVGQAEGVRRVESKSFTGLSLVIVEFEDNIDRTAAVKQVRSYVVAQEYYQAPGSVPPLVFALDADLKIR